LAPPGARRSAAGAYPRGEGRAADAPESDAPFDADERLVLELADAMTRDIEVLTR
jgi:hypothetical protein